jgi:ATP-binding cassette, subfamily C (CFTR/MRP), member 1
VSRAVYWRQSYRMIAKIRSGLIGKIYRHTTELRASAVKDSAAITLMGTDVERIVQSLRLVHELWATMPEVAVAVYLLARQMSAAAVAPMVICIGQFRPHDMVSLYYLSAVSSLMSIRLACFESFADYPYYFVASIAATSPVAARFGPAQRRWVECVEKRVAVTASMLGDMKAVKMLGLSSVLKDIILQLRKIELQTSEKFRALLVWTILIGR